MRVVLKCTGIFGLGPVILQDRERQNLPLRVMRVLFRGALQSDINRTKRGTTWVSTSSRDCAGARGRRGDSIDVRKRTGCNVATTQNQIWFVGGTTY